jgi:hypothetical protein
MPLVPATLLCFLRPAMLKYQKRGQPLSPFEVAPIYQLPIQQTAVIALPMFPNNEAKVSEITVVVRGIVDKMGYTWEEVWGLKIVFVGDFLTTRNTEYCSPLLLSD